MKRTRSILAAGWTALCLSVCADGTWTDAETVTAYLTTTLHTAVSDVRVHSSDEAAALVDRYFAHVPEAPHAAARPDPARRLQRMKHLLENEFAFVYSFSIAADDLTALAGETAPDASVYVFQPRVFSGADICSYPPRILIGPRRTDCAEYVVLSKADGRVVDCFIRGIGNGHSEGQPLPFRNRKLETEVRVPSLEANGRQDEAEPEAVVVADVEGVFFDSIRNMNPSCVKAVTPTSYTLISPVATYRVELLVRRVEEGTFPYERLAFTVDPVRDLMLCEVWPFYRGMTLGVVLCRIDGALRVRRVEPVLPYPPFTACAQLFTDSLVHRYDSSRSSRFALNARAADLRPGEVAACLAVQYGEHTLAKFFAPRNGITGRYGDFPDYQDGATVEVWTASEGADPDYWRDAWFASPMDEPCLSSDATQSCSVRNAEEGLDDLARLKFRWGPCRVDSRISHAQTLGDVVVLLDAAAVCTGCGRRHDKLTVETSVAARRVVMKKPLFPQSVFDALEQACEQTGCRFTVDGTNVVISASLSDTELADDSLQGRLRVLERAGFASVAGAQYADVSFWRRDTKSEAESPVGELPIRFYSGDYGLTGDGWIRTTADGRHETLAFDSAWWPSDGAEGFRAPEKARLARDIAKVRAYLRDAAADPDDFELRRDAEKSDRFALAFALHVHQAGSVEEAQTLFDALKLRPGAEPDAFHSLLSRIRRFRTEYPDFPTWLEKSVDPRTKGKTADGE